MCIQILYLRDNYILNSYVFLCMFFEMWKEMYFLKNIRCCYFFYCVNGMYFEDYVCVESYLGVVGFGRQDYVYIMDFKEVVC